MNPESTVVVHMTKVMPNSTVASTRIATFISEQLCCPLLDTTKKICNAKDAETVILVNGPSAFCEEGLLDSLAELVATAKTFVWCSNDYTVYPATQIRTVLDDNPDLRVLSWSATPEWPENFLARQTYMRILKDVRYINWNSLTYNPRPIPDSLQSGLLYWGAYRQRRAKEFERFFETSMFPVKVSCTRAGGKKFEELDSRIELIPPLTAETWPAMTTLYIQDDLSSKFYTSPANRFYEALSAGIPMYFQPESATTFERAGFSIDRWVVNGPRELAISIQKEVEAGPNHSGRVQRELWGHDFVGDLRIRLQELYKDLV